jgi:hypothetical protein
MTQTAEVLRSSTTKVPRLRKTVIDKIVGKIFLQYQHNIIAYKKTIIALISGE